MGVFCFVDCNIKVKINCQGIWIEKLEYNSGKYILEELCKVGEGEVVCVDFNCLMKEIFVQLLQYFVFICLLFNGMIIVGCDIVYVKLKEWMDNGEGLLQYIKDYLIYYVGLVKMLEGYVFGFFGLMIVGWMDFYVD